MNDVCRFSRDHVVGCSERTVLSCLEPVYVGDVSGDTSPIIWQRVKVTSGIFARRAMVDQARKGLCYQRRNLTFLMCLT